MEERGGEIPALSLLCDCRLFFFLSSFSFCTLLSSDPPTAPNATLAVILRAQGSKEKVELGTKRREVNKRICMDLNDEEEQKHLKEQLFSTPPQICCCNCHMVTGLHGGRGCLCHCCCWCNYFNDGGTNDE